MRIVCPTITATNDEDYARQINNVSGFVRRLHIDLMDGQLAPTRSIYISKVWWPKNLIADIHLMYREPLNVLDELISLKPHMVIIHKEADVDHRQMVDGLHSAGIKAGLALLGGTKLELASAAVSLYDQLLIFSGNLGHQGGQADLNLLKKVSFAKEHYPDKEIAWDGGINDENIMSLVNAGVNVLDVGSYIQSNPNPKSAYDKLLNSLIE